MMTRWPVIPKDTTGGPVGSINCGGYPWKMLCLTIRNSSLTIKNSCLTIRNSSLTIKNSCWTIEYSDLTSDSWIWLRLNIGYTTRHGNVDGEHDDRRILGYTIFGQPHKGLNQGYLCLRLPSIIHFYLLLENLRISIHFEVSNTNDLLVEHAKPMSPFKNICFSPSEKESETMSRTSCTPWHPMVTLLEVCVLSPLRGSAAPRTPADSYMPRWCPKLRPENQFGSSPIDVSCAADRCRDDLMDIASGFLRVGFERKGKNLMLDKQLD